MTNHPEILLKPETLKSPILDSLSEMAVKYLGLRLVVVYPTPSGMAQFVVGSSHYLPDFCKLVQGSREGREHCRMCHLLMAQPDPEGTNLIKRCHTGASSLVKYISGEKGSSLAVLTSCALVDADAESSWSVIQRRGRKLGIDEQMMKKAHQNLRKLNTDKMEMAGYILNMAAQALQLILDKLSADARLEQERSRHKPDAVITSAIQKELRNAALNRNESDPDNNKGDRKRSASLIDIVTDVVKSNPQFPYRLSAIAAACRITPNHFSHLFHEQHKQCFSEFLTEQRLTLAKTLLKDLTLNVAQVATGAGFRDAGYFARRFRQMNGVSPSEWRQTLLVH